MGCGGAGRASQWRILCCLTVRSDGFPSKSRIFGFSPISPAAMLRPPSSESGVVSCSTVQDDSKRAFPPRHQWVGG